MSKVLNSSSHQDISMKRNIGQFLFWLGAVLNWLIHLGASGYGIFFIVMEFRNDGVLSGLLSILIVGVGMTFVHLGLSLISLPYMFLVHLLLGKELDDI